ncbi:MAG: alpha/beta hydrolase [Anaerolineales bacterium]|nr:alpha/beta hydrolase [Anaerolineales bacterium]MCB8953391.1 alpha/beta hydrolase [Ardenticatenales bacterium]
MPFWTADDGTKIHYERFGEQSAGNHLLLLPGLLGAISSQWRGFHPVLENRFRLTLMDLRGHGLSENRQPDLRPERMLQDIVGLLDHLGIENLHVAGYSLGGYLGLMLALNQPRRVYTVLMHATKFYWSQETVEKIKRQLDPDRIADRAPSYANQLAEEHGASRWRALARQGGDLVAIIHEKGLTEGMAARAQCPVLVSVGDRDEMVPLSEALRLSRVIPAGELLVLPGVRHPLASVRPVPFLPAMQFFHQRPTTHA